MPTAPKWEGETQATAAKGCHADTLRAAVPMGSSAASVKRLTLRKGENICLQLTASSAGLLSRSAGGEGQNQQDKPRPLRPLEEGRLARQCEGAARLCPQDMAWASRGGHAQGPRRQPGHTGHGPRPQLSSCCHQRVRPPRSLPREETQACSIHSLPGGQELRSEAWAERALAGRLLPTPSQAHCPWRPGLGVSPSRGVRPTHPPPHPPAHGVLPCTPVSMRGLQGGRSRLQPGPSLGQRSLSPPMAPTANHQGQLGLHTSRSTPTDRDQTLETGAALAAEPTDHTGVHCPGPSRPGPPSWEDLWSLTHVCPTRQHALRSVGGDTQGRGPSCGPQTTAQVSGDTWRCRGVGRPAQEGSCPGWLRWLQPLLSEAKPRGSRGHPPRPTHWPELCSEPMTGPSGASPPLCSALSPRSPPGPPPCPVRAGWRSGHSADSWHRARLPVSGLGWRKRLG